MSLRGSLQVRLAFIPCLFLGHQSTQAWGTQAGFHLAPAWSIVVFGFYFFFFISKQNLAGGPSQKPASITRALYTPTSLTLFKHTFLMPHPRTDLS